MRSKLFIYEEAKGLFNELDAKARQHGCTVVSVQLGGNGPINVVSEEESETIIEGIESTVMMVGQYQDLILFLRELQNYPRGIFIRSLQMLTLEDKQGSLQCRIDITIYISHEKEIDYND